MKRTFFAALLCLLYLTAHAQWKVTSVDNAEISGNEFIQILQTEQSTLIYCTLTQNDGNRHMLVLDRGTSVKANGQSYKIKNSVNLPLDDEAESRSVVLDNQFNTVNYVMEFEKFDPSNGFDIVESATKHDDSMFNFQGIHVEKLDDSATPLDTERFLDCPLIIHGRYYNNGQTNVFFIKNGLMITQHCSLEGDPIFYTRIVNNSGHGVNFDFNKVKVVGIKNKKDGPETTDAKLFTPDKYDSKLASNRYYAAKAATGGYEQDRLTYKLRSESYNNKNSSWARAGFSALGFLSQKAEENRINKYLQDHPDNGPKALRSNSMKDGDEMNGYIAAKNKRYNKMKMTITMDGYDFPFTWTLKK